jgi:hypothetical protein
MESQQRKRVGRRVQIDRPRRAGDTPVSYGRNRSLAHWSDSRIILPARWRQWFEAATFGLPLARLVYPSEYPKIWTTSESKQWRSL